MARVIFTADDYGAIPSIDRGIIAAVKAGKINSVAAFSNAPRSVNSIQHLIQSADNVEMPLEVGCHLTITSGKPLSKDVDWMTKRGQFRKFGDLNRPKDVQVSQQIDGLKNELRAQIDVLIKHKIPVMHLSSHHGALTWFADYTQALFEIGREYDIPVRSPHFIPAKENNTYLSLVNHLLKLNLPMAIESTLRNFRKNYSNEVNKILDSFGNQRTSATDSSHYGPLPLLSFSLKHIKAEYPKKRSDFEKRLAHLSSEQGIIEFMFHIIEDDFEQLKKFKKESTRGRFSYKGIDRSYFDSRIIEMKSLMELEFPKGVELSSWT